MERKSGGPSMQKLKSICVFGGSTLGRDEVFLRAADELGKAMAARNIDVVYGGGIYGLRGNMARSAVFGGSKVLGVVLKPLVDKNPRHIIGTEIQASSIYERMSCMFCHANAFLALPGGLGTLEEISAIISWAKLKLHKKPLGLLNVNGFYDSLLAFLDKAVEQDFIDQATRSLIVSTSDINQLIELLENLTPTPILSLTQVELHTQDSNRKRKEPDTTLQLF